MFKSWGVALLYRVLFFLALSFIIVSQFRNVQGQNWWAFTQKCMVEKTVPRASLTEAQKKRLTYEQLESTSPQVTILVNSNSIVVATAMLMDYSSLYLDSLGKVLRFKFHRTQDSVWEELRRVGRTAFISIVSLIMLGCFGLVFSVYYGAANLRQPVGMLETLLLLLVFFLSFVGIFLVADFGNKAIEDIRATTEQTAPTATQDEQTQAQSSNADEADKSPHAVLILCLFCALAAFLALAWLQPENQFLPVQLARLADSNPWLYYLVSAGGLLFVLFAGLNLDQSMEHWQTNLILVAFIGLLMASLGLRRGDIGNGVFRYALYFFSGLPVFTLGHLTIYYGLRSPELSWGSLALAAIILMVGDGTLTDFIRSMEGDVMRLLTHDSMNFNRVTFQTPSKYLFRHLRSPLYSLLATRFFQFLSSAIVVEFTLSIPGLSDTLLNSVRYHDFQGIVFILLFSFFTLEIVRFVTLVLTLQAEPQRRIRESDGEA